MPGSRAQWLGAGTAPSQFFLHPHLEAAVLRLIQCGLEREPWRPQAQAADVKPLLPTRQMGKLKLPKVQGPAQSHCVAELRFEPQSASQLHALPSTRCCLPGWLERHLSLGTHLIRLPRWPLGIPALPAPLPPALGPQPAGRAGLRETGSTGVICFDAQMKEAMLTGTASALKAVPTPEGPPSVPTCLSRRNSCPLFTAAMRGCDMRNEF